MTKTAVLQRGSEQTSDSNRHTTIVLSISANRWRQPAGV